MRTLAVPLAAVLAIVLAVGGASRADRETCEQAFRAYDSATWLYPTNSWNEDQTMLRPEVSRAAVRLVRGGCLTSSYDLGNLDALGASLAPFTMDFSGPTIRPATVELGIVLGWAEEREVTRLFRGLGYRSRGIGAPTLGRALYIGPFTSQGALDQALEVARQAGFIAPHVSPRVRF